MLSVSVTNMEVIDKLKDLTKEEKIKLSKNIFSSGWALTPISILNDNSISPHARILYGNIASLCASTGYCWATNEYFAKALTVNVRTIIRAMVELDKYLIIRNGGTATRTIWVAVTTGVGGDINVPTKKKTGKKSKNEKKQKVVKYKNEDLELAEYLLAKIIYNYPVYENKEVVIADWADDIRLLREVERATYEQIYFMITWLHGGEIIKEGKQPRIFQPHDFWSKNIMSAKKLRKQWLENLVPQLQSSIKKSTVAQL